MKDITKSFVRQHDQSDCGVACLASIIKFYDGEFNLHELRKISGTSKSGTTLLGLYQAAKEIGFEAEGLEAESVGNLAELTTPAILHVVIENRLQHYVVFYPSQDVNRPFSSDSFIIGDPSKGLTEMSSSELNAIWQSKALLKLTATSRIQNRKINRRKKWEWILSLVKEDSTILLVSLFLGIIISILGVSTAIFSQKLIDYILPNAAKQNLILSLALLAVLLLVRTGLTYLRSLFIVKQGEDFNNRIIQIFYNNLLRLPKSFFDTRKTGDLIARMNDTRRIQLVVSTVLGTIVIDFLIVIVSVSIMFVYSAQIGFLMLAIIPLYLFILIRFNKPIVRNQREVMTAYALTESHFVDSLQGVSEIKLLNKQSFFASLNASIYGLFQRSVADLGKLNARFGLISEFIGVFILILILGFTSWMVISSAIKVGEMVAIIGLAGSIIPSISRLVVANIQIQEALVTFDRMYEFTSMEMEQMNGAEPSINVNEVAVKIQDLSFRFPGRSQILKNVNMQFGTGEIVGLLGESGCGKSTLAQLIQKFYSPETGKILIGDSDLTQISTEFWRRQVASVPQEVKIFNGNLLYNLTLSDNPADYQEAITFCEQEGFGNYFNEFPQGYLTLLGEEGINISGGQKQLVAIARSLFRKPKILLLDEATSSMDKKTENFIMNLLERNRHNMAVLLITHNTHTANHCNRLYRISHGSVS